MLSADVHMMNSRTIRIQYWFPPPPPPSTHTHTTLSWEVKSFYFMHFGVHSMTKHITFYMWSYHNTAIHSLVVRCGVFFMNSNSDQDYPFIVIMMYIVLFHAGPYGLGHQLIAKPGNQTAASPWPKPYIIMGPLGTILPECYLFLEI